MNVDKIIEKITQDARADAAAAIEAAQAKAAQAAAQVAAEADRKIAEIELNAKKEIEEIYRRKGLIAKLEGRKGALAKRREVLDEAFAAAYRELAALSGGQWEALITRIVLESAETGTEKLRVPAKDMDKYRSGVFEKLGAAFSGTGALLDKLNAALVSRGKHGGLALDETPATFEDGVALIGERSEVNGSFEALLRGVRESCERDVADVLFPRAEVQ